MMYVNEQLLLSYELIIHFFVFYKVDLDAKSRGLDGINSYSAFNKKFVLNDLTAQEIESGNHNFLPNGIDAGDDS